MSLVHSGNIGSQSVDYARYAGFTPKLLASDIRDTNPTPNDLIDFGVSAWFSNIWNPTGATWNSGFTVRGWNAEYAVWQLASSANYGGNTQALYYRLGEDSTWYDWRRLLFNNDDNARFLNSSIVNGKYNTALTLQTNVASRANYQCGLAFNCLGAYSSTYENHTHAWVGLGPVVNTAAAEIYPLVFAVNGDTTAGTNPIERMRIMPNGNVGIGTTNPKSKLDVNGNISASGAITAGTASDRRLKDNICTIDQNKAIEVLMGLNPITFIWSEKATELGGFEGISQGFVAQEYESIIPNSGRAIWGEYRAIDYTKAIPYIVSVEQNHEQRIRQLEEELNRLRREYYGIQ